MGIAPVEVTRSLKEDMARRGKTLEIGRVVESLDGHLISALGAVGKFNIVARSDLAKLMREQDIGASGIIDITTAAASGKVKGLENMVVVTVDSFNEQNQVRDFSSGRSARSRLFQLSAQAKIFATDTGELIDAPNFQIEQREVRDQVRDEKLDSEATDQMMPLLAREMAEKVARKVVETLYPAKIIDIEGKVVTINRGLAMGVTAGEVWTAYGPTKTITDDSGEVIKRKGLLLGRVRITSVESNYSQGEIIEGTGIVVGSVLNAEGKPAGNR
jgi:curli biogenesis system outer membrane secretion channel CsgG